MRIAMIGTGNVGGALGVGWSKAGHDVVFGSRDPKGEVASLLQSRTGDKAEITEPSEAASQADVVVLAIPWSVVPQVLEQLAPSLDNKILVDCTNPVKQWPVLDHSDGSGGEQVQKMAPHARVVKAFNCTGAENMLDPMYKEGSVTMFYAGNDAEAKKTVRGLIQDLGFDPVDAGGLSQSYHLEVMASLWGGLAYGQNLGRGIAFRLMQR